MVRVEGAEPAVQVSAKANRLRALELPAPLTTTAIAFAVFWVGFDHGAFATTTRSWIALVAACAVALTVAIGAWPRATPTRGALICVALLTAFALLQAASIAWGATAEAGFVELNRTLGYAAVFAVVVCAATRADAARSLDAIALGLTALTLLALTSRCFPHVVSEGTLAQFLPDAHARLSYPVGYWNGLAVLCALAIPLLLRVACVAESAWGRGGALAIVPLVSAVVYLASSRTGAIVAAVGATVFIAFAADHWTAGVALVVGAAASAAVGAFLSHEHALVNGPLRSHAAVAEGRVAALVVLVVAAAAGAVFTITHSRVRAPRVPRRGAIAIVAAAVVVAAAGVAAAHPVARWHEFTAAPAVAPNGPGINEHLVSVNGNLRWQLWNGSVEMFRARPLAGYGAGRFAEWWTMHGGVEVATLNNAHSLYFQTLGELGGIGFALLAAFVVTGLALGTARARRAAPFERGVAAAALAAFAGYAVSLGLDWMWQLTAVSTVGIALLGLLLAATGRASTARVRVSGSLRVVVVVAAAAAAVMQADLLAATKLLESSQQAAAADQLAPAYSRAKRAREFEPWAATPYLQLALVAEAQHHYADARHRIRQALDREGSDWRLWLVATRIEKESGRIAAAVAAWQKANHLAPRSDVVWATHERLRLPHR